MGRLERARRAASAWRVRRQLARADGYSFTADYTATVRSRWPELFEGVAGRPGVRMLEIGAYEGRSALWFLEHVLTGEGSSIVCLDFFSRPWWDLRFDHNIARSGHAERVTKLKGHSHVLLPGLEAESFDVVYVDGGHAAATVLLDGVLSWRLLKPGGLLVFDDYLWAPGLPETERPRMAIDAFLELVDGRAELVLHDYQVAVTKRS
jgi:predicted O-methyltransferase YrrM